ncbi:hypothetical protein IP84_04245 [beta proteobacterium AAP99]|nr:hypothetical protein IP84_04245 [beta proteobacterium AAP99]
MLKNGLFPIRRRTGTADFHLSKKAVTLTVRELEQLDERDAVLLLATMSWGSCEEMACPHCGTFDRHYWYEKELRWKCTACDAKFSVTSGTVLASRKLPVRTILRVAFEWMNGAAGKAALEIRRNWGFSYPTHYTLLQKLREGLVRGYNVGMLVGYIEMDGMDVNGRRYKEKRNRPQITGAGKRPSMPVQLLAPKVDPDTGEITSMGPPKPVKYDKTSRQHPDRRQLLVVRVRSAAKGGGAVRTRIAVALRETSDTVTRLATSSISAESFIHTDEDPAYAKFVSLYAGHKTVTHSKMYVAPDGTNNNQAECLNARMRRSVEQIYLNVSNKYLNDYACENAWRDDTRRTSNGDRLKHLMRLALSVGLSQFWRGYTHGKHRSHEMLIEGPKPAKPRGRRVGWEPMPAR